MHQVNKISLFVLGLLRNVMHILPFRGRGRVALYLSSVFLPKTKVCVPLRTGANMVLDFQNKHEVWMFFDIFCEAISKVQKQLLRDGDIFVDCGANVGYFSFLAAPIVTKSGKVIAIDANPYCIERIKESKTIGNHDNVEIKGVAIGECEGKISFNVADDPMYSSISDTDRLDWTSTKESINVKVEPLDKILQNVITGSGKRIRLLKLDIEGAEIMAMLGAKKLLEARKIDYIYLELHPIQLKLMGHETDEFHSIMNRHGYRQNRTDKPTDFIYSSPDVSA